MKKTENKTRVLFVCTGNSARSQMAEGLLRHHYGDRFEVHSAGMYPGKLLDAVVQAMDEIGIDISWHEVKSVENYYKGGIIFDHVITVCANAAPVCPIFPGVKETINWTFDDPASYDDPEERLRVARKSRDEILAALHAWVAGVEHPAPPQKSFFKNLLQRL